ncbi:MAG: cytochrome c [Bacteroidota bacterium]
MDALQDIALPRGLEHYELLLLMFNIVYGVFSTYSAFLAGSVLLGLYWERRRERGAARRVLGFALHTVHVPLVLGLLPGITLLFLLAQLLGRSSAPAAGLFGYGMCLACAGGAGLLWHTFTFRLEGLLEPRVQGGLPPEEAAFLRATALSRARSGVWGGVFLFGGVFLCMGGITSGLSPESSPEGASVAALLLSGSVWARSALFLALALSAGGAGVLFFDRVWQGGMPPPEPPPGAPDLETVSLRWSSAGLLVMPVMIPLHMVLQPAASRSGDGFAFAALALGAFFLALLFLYAFHREGSARMAGFAFLSVVAGAALLASGEREAMGVATQGRAARLAQVHAEMLTEERARLGRELVKASGEEILAGRCSACHLFDGRKVGPPYNDVLPKYAGRKAELAAFVLNPVKVNPAYPAMPNQGLKPAEADSVAAYLLGRMKNAGGSGAER